MEVKDIAASLKDWFFDLAGLFLPGATLVFVLSLIYSNHGHLSDIQQHYDHDIKISFAYFVTAYVAGYFVYGLSMISDSAFDFIHKGVSFIPSKANKKASIIGSSGEYALFKKLIVIKSESDAKEDLIAFLELDDFDEIRSMAMSCSPESDSKIYNFTFRSEICNHLGTVLLVCSIVGLLASITNNRSMAWFSLVFFCLGVLLKFVRMGFLDAAYKVPFSVANTKLALVKS